LLPRSYSGNHTAPFAQVIRNLVGAIDDGSVEVGEDDDHDAVKEQTEPTASWCEPVLNDRADLYHVNRPTDEGNGELDREERNERDWETDDSQSEDDGDNTADVDRNGKVTRDAAYPVTDHPAGVSNRDASLGLLDIHDEDEGKAKQSEKATGRCPKGRRRK